MKFDEAAHKCAIVIDSELPGGLAINAASIIGISFGRAMENLVGPDLKSNNDVVFPGVIYTPLPILVASNFFIHDLHRQAGDDEYILTIPFSSLAQSCKTYDEYDERVSSTDSNDINLVAIGIIGPKKKIKKMTGSLSLFR